MTAPRLETVIGRIRMANPVMTASGTFGYGTEYADLVDLRKLGAMVVKGISLRPWAGNPPPRLVEVRGGLLNAIGLQNPGFEGFARDYWPALRQIGIPVIVNIWGRTIEEYEAVAARFEALDGLAGLELNVSCPNIKEGGMAFGTDPAMLERVVGAVRRKTTRTLLVKLAPNVTRIEQMARVAEAAGADALSLINTYPAMALDIETRRPRLSNGIGGLSGPAIHPIAVKLVYEAARAVQIPVIGMGGILDWRDAVEFLIAGARAVAVGSVSLSDPTAAISIVEGIRAYLERHGLEDVSELVGSIRWP
jgi:dihydroorotate dehydrogenase (NAD+) catalytic subunit